MSHVYDINGNYYSCNSSSRKVIEGFSLNIGNKTDIKDNSLVKKATDIEKDINQSMVVKGMTKLLSSVMNDVANSNASSLTQMIALSNAIEISNVNTEGTFKMSGLDQESSGDSTTNIKSQQNIQNKISTDISKKLSNKIDSVVNDYTQKSKDVQIAESKATNVGDVFKSLGNNIADVLSVGIGNSTSKTTNKTVIDDLKNKLKLDKSFTMAKDKDVSDKISNTLSSKNMAKCAKDSKQANNFKLDKINAKAGVDLGSLKQTASVKSVLSCAFNQTILTEIASKIVSDLDENIKRMQKSADKYAEANKTSSTSGDIYAAGVASKALLQGVGEAAVPVGQGIAAAAEGVGKGLKSAGQGVSIAAEGVGKGIGSIFMPLVIGAIVIALIGGVVAYFKFKAKKGDDDD